jgi:uncharacterized protein
MSITVPRSTPGAEPPPMKRRSGIRAHRRRLGSAVAVTLVAGGLAACGSGAAASTTHPTCGPGAPKMTVAGSGQASASPDTLTVDIGVAVSGASASSALSDANQRATALTNSLKTSGVVPSDIQSTNFSINPTFSLSGAITGYQVTNTLLVTLHDLSRAGEAVDAAAASAGDAIRINGLTFSVSNTSTVDGQARADAVAVAAGHARTMAAAAGESLDGVCSIDDSTVSPVYPFAGQLNAAGSHAAVPLEPGTQQANAQVTVVYAISRK